MFKLLIVTCGVLGLTSSSSLPAEKCASSDSKCIKAYAAKAIPIFAKGIPEYGVKSMEPMILEKVDASTPGLKFIVYDFKVAGFSTCKPKKIERKGNKLHVRLVCPELRADGRYELDGQLLVVRIKSKGSKNEMHVVLNDIHLNADLDMDIETRDGKRYWVIKSFKHSYELTKKSTLQFDGINEGNEQLDPITDNLFATSANEIIVEIGDKIMKAVGDECVGNIGRYLNREPYDKFSID